MSLAATLAAGGMRPASFLPTIKCSQCGNEIEISAMGDHECTKAQEPPQSSSPSPKSGHETLNSPYALRPMNSNHFQPAQPSPLQFDSPPPPPPAVPMPMPPPQQTRQRAPTIGSSQPSNQRIPRPALPRINADVANKPFLAPHAQNEMPLSPAASTRSASSASGKPPPPLRSMTSPMPRLWDPRPPSPELSANLDCAFPPFPMFNETRSRRPSASSGRKTPNGSERGPSRSSSRQGHRFNDVTNMGPGSPTSSKANPFEPPNRRPSNDERREEPLPPPADRRRPSSPGSLNDEPPPLPPLSKIESFQAQQPQPIRSNTFDAPKSPSPPPDFAFERKVPPARPARPTESLTPSLLDTLRTEPASSISSFPIPPVPKGPGRSNTFPRPQDGNEEAGAPLAKMRSEPAFRDNEQRPSLPDSAQSEPSQIPQSLFPARNQSKNEARVDYRLQDAPPVPKPVQAHQTGSSHKPSGSNSSSASSSNSLRMTNSSVASPVTSAASSVDVFSPLAQEIGRTSEDNGLRVAGLNVNKSQIKPGMRAEQPKEKSPPRNFARPAPPREIPLPPTFEESPVVPTFGSWPLESPMDPAMKNGKLGDDGQDPAAAFNSSSLAPPSLGSNLNPNLSAAAAFNADDFDPYRALTPAANPESQPQHQPNGSESYFKAFDPTSTSRSQTPKPSKPQTPPQGRPRSRTESSQGPPPPPPPPVPDEPYESAPNGLQRRPTVGGKSMCRGCGLLIEGKSIKSADGNLTGRWHKGCFVCKTCELPFHGNEFYVIKNQPYCHQHYHEKNQSLCFGCRKGIEGQYLETRSQDARGLVVRKYHPKCFMCITCRKPLTDDYFDVQGRVYCETHAMASQRTITPRRTGPGGSLINRNGPPPGLSPHGHSGLRAERRTTKMGTTNK